MNDDLINMDLSGFELVPDPLIKEGETPLQFVSRLHPELDWSGVDSITWDDVANNEHISNLITRLIGLSTKPSFILLKKKPQ